MGWTVHYQLLREQPLTEEERGVLGSFVARAQVPAWDAETFNLAVSTGARADRVYAYGMQKIPMNLDESPDPARLVRTLNELLDLFPGSELRISDDFGAFGQRRQRCSLEGEKTPEPLEVGDAGFDRAQRWAAPDAAPRPTLPEGDDGTVVRAALEGYERELGGAAVDAMRRLVDLGPVVPAFLEMWGRERGIYYHHDIGFPPEFAARLVADPRVVARLEADIAQADADGTHEERVYRRAGKAVELLALRAPPEPVALFVDLLRRRRARALFRHHEHHVVDAVQRALAERADPRCFATFVIEIDRMTYPTVAASRMLVALARMNPARARPISLRLLDVLGFADHLAEALVLLDPADGVPALHHLLAVTCGRVRDHVAWVMRKHGIDPGDAPAPPPESLLASPSDEVRAEAIRTLAVPPDKSRFLSLALGEMLDARLRVRTENAGLPYHWMDWKDILPELIRNMRPGERVTWAQKHGRAVIGPQVVWDSVKPVLELGSRAVAETIPVPRLRLGAEERAAWLAEEASLFG